MFMDLLCQQSYYIYLYLLLLLFVPGVEVCES